MGSSFYQENSNDGKIEWSDTWSVANRVFWGTLRFMVEVGKDAAATPQEQQWVQYLGSFIENDLLSADLEVTEFFESAEEVQFWSNISFEVGRRLYRREIGNQEDQTWQPVYIWAAWGLAQLFSRVYRGMSRPAN